MRSARSSPRRYSSRAVVSLGIVAPVHHARRAVKRRAHCVEERGRGGVACGLVLVVPDALLGCALDCGGLVLACLECLPNLVSGGLVELMHGRYRLSGCGLD